VPRFDLFDLAGALVDYAETTLLHIGALMIHIGALTIHIGALPRESGLPESVSDRGALTDGGSQNSALYIEIQT